MTPLVSFREFVTSDRFVGRSFADDSWKPLMTIAQIGGTSHPTRAMRPRKPKLRVTTPSLAMMPSCPSRQTGPTSGAHKKS